MALYPVHRSRSRRPCIVGVETLESRRLLSFITAVPYATTFRPYAIATADFNNDGKLDLAATIGYDAGAKVSVRLGNGTGGFGTSTEFAAPTWGNPSSIFVADLNNDTRLDIILGGFESHTTLFGNGDGTFQAGVHHMTGYGLAYAGHFVPGQSAVLGVSTWLGADWETHVQLSWGDGQGGFTRVGQDGYYWGWSNFVPVNLNNDASIDVVTGEGGVFIGEAWGLRFDWEHGAGLRGGAVATGDFTGDGFADVVVANDSIAVLRGRGDCTLEEPVLYPAGNGTAASSIATGDFNGDGKLDIVVTDAVEGKACVMIGNGDGTLRFGGAFAVGASPRSVTVGDFNGDGRPDLAVANYNSTNVSVLLNDGNWAVLPPAPPPPPTLSVSDATVIEGNTGTRNATFTLTLSTPAAADVTVGYGPGSDTAMPVEDYDTIGGSVTIPAGQASATFNIAVKGDLVPEPTETFYAILGTPSNAMLVDGYGIGTILNDDGKRWAGPAGGSWSTPSSWSPVGVPGIADHVVVDAGSVNINGSATVASLTLTGGATLGVGALGSRVLRTSSLALAGNSRIDLHDNSLILDYTGTSPMSTVRAALNSGYASGAWDGQGINSSTSATVPGTGISFAEASELFTSFPATFAGQSVDSTSILLRYTLLGDADCNRRVDLDDFSILASNFNQPGRTFARGNFNYDLAGDVDLSDFNIFASNFGRLGTAARSGILNFADSIAVGFNWASNTEDEVLMALD